jgi:hypothetical protein
MKTYKTSFTSYIYLITYACFILQLSLNLSNGKYLYFKFIAIILNLLIIILVISKARYILNDQYIIIKGFLESRKIDIMTIESISIKKVQLFKKYNLEIKTGRYNRTFLHPRQVDIDNFIKDIVDINPNIIVHEFKP